MVNVSQVMTRPVATLAEQRTVRDAARLMNKRRIGSAIVTRAGKVVGIVTEGDLLRVIARGKVPERIRLKAVMTTPVIVGEETMDLQDAVKLMVLNNIKKLPILRGKRLIGILTLTDFARVEPFYHEFFLRALRGVKQETRKRFTKYLAKEPPQGMYA